jgi:hypothetical protein
VFSWFPKEFAFHETQFVPLHPGGGGGAGGGGDGSSKEGDGGDGGGGGGGGGSAHFYTPPPGRLGAIGATAKREQQFEAWVREPVPTEGASNAKHSGFGASPVIGPVEVRAVWGRGRGLVTTRNVTRGETLMELPLMKCLSTASARGSAIGPTLATITSPDVSIDGRGLLLAYNRPRVEASSQLFQSLYYSATDVTTLIAA